MRQTTIIILLLFSLTGTGQSFAVTGQVKNPFNDYSANVMIYAFSLHSDTIFNCLTDSTGKFSFGTIPPGRYKIKLGNLYGSTEDTISIPNSKTHLNFTFPKCENPNSSGVCSKCQSKKFVVPIAPYVIHDTWFKTPEDSIKYYIKIDKLGYQIEDNKLIAIRGKANEKAFLDPCRHWFCKRHKFIF